MSRIIRFSLSACFIVSLFTPAYGQNAASLKTTLLLKSGSILVDKDTTTTFLETLQQSRENRLRGFARVRRIPKRSEREALSKEGIHLFEFISKKTYRVTVEKGASLENRLANEIIESVVEIRSEDKIAPMIALKQFAQFVAPSMTDPEGESEPYVLNEDGTVNLTIIFADDVSDAQAVAILRSTTQSFEFLTKNAWVVRMDPELIEQLAANAMVQWIEAAPAPPVLELNNSRNAIQVNPVHAIQTAHRPPSFDFTGGGDRDLLVGADDGQVFLFQNIGTDATPMYSAGAPLQAGGGNLDAGDRAVMTWGDRDDDGDLDLLVGRANGDILIYVNNGTDAVQNYAAGVNVQAGGVNLNVGANAAPLLWDSEYDGDRDLVVGRGDGEVWLYVNGATDVAPVYGAGSAIQADGANVDVGDNAQPTYQDMDGDGDQDLIVGNGDGQVQWFRNDGTDAAPNYAAGQVIQVAGVPLDVGEDAAPLFFDVDIDLDEDLVIGNADGEVWIYSNVGTNAAPVFAAGSAVEVGGINLDVGANAAPRFIDFDLDGVRVGNAEWGDGDWRHGDFEGRIVFRPGAPTIHPFNANHATHVFGIMTGNGTKSDQVNATGALNPGTPYQFRGMALRAGIAFRMSIGTAQNYFNVAVTDGADLINGSISVSADGVYNAANVLRDNMVRGDGVWAGNSVPATPTIYSAGNSGTVTGFGQQIDYFSLTKQFKNVIVVGNWDATAVPPTLSARSSMGPAYDGRLKPDVVAPGSFVRSTRRTVLDGYMSMGGTSMSSPATAGVIGLFLEAWSRTYGIHLDDWKPLPSTLRGVLINTTQDIDWVNNPPPGGANPTRVSLEGPVSFFPGPDFPTGWGLVNAQGGSTTIQARQIIEGEMEDGDIVNVPFTMPDATPVRVTLAWDDVAASPALPLGSILLVNDLDFILIDPTGNTWYPFSPNQQIVDPANPANVIPPAAQVPGTPIQVNTLLTPNLAPPPGWNGVDYAGNIPVAASPIGRDHLNNVEQVLADGQAGNWIAQISGFSVPTGPQNFSVIGPWGADVTPPDITCSENFEIEGEGPDGISSDVLTLEVLGISATDLRDPIADITDDAPAMLPLGDTVVTFTATDDAGNTAECGVMVSVVDTTPPVLTCPEGPQTLECTSPDGAPSDGIIDVFGVSAVDVIDGAPVITDDAPNPIPGDGPVLVTFTATDASDNASSCSVIVTTVDTTPPAVTCPDSEPTFAADGPDGLSTASVAWTDYVGTASDEDTCDPGPIITTDAPNPIPLGQTVVNFTATDALGNTSESCAVTVEVVLPSDIVLVLDDTGSMSQLTGDGTGNQKIESLRGGVEVFTDILQEFREGLGDRIGVTTFKVPPEGDGSLACQEEWAQELVPMGDLDDTLPLIQPAVDDMPADGWWTPIRSGMETASVQLSEGEEGRRRMMLLMSDGKENTSNCMIGPEEEDITNFKNAFILHPDFQIRLLAVGFGAGGQIDADLLNTLATNGFYDSASSDQELDEWFVESLADVLNQVLVLDPIGTLASGAVTTNDVPLTSLAKSATFIATWARDEAELNLAVRTPGGALITAADGRDSNSGVTALSGSTYKALILRFPLGGRLSDEHAGRWVAELSRSQTNRGDDEPYSLMVMADAPLRIHPGILRIPFFAGHVLPLQLKLPETILEETKIVAQIFSPTAGLGTQLAAMKLTDKEVLSRTKDMTMDASLLDRRHTLLMKKQRGAIKRTVSSVQLFDDGRHQDGLAGDRIYGAKFPALKAEGNYSVRYTVEGLTTEGEPFRREFKQGFRVGLDLASGATNIRIKPLDKRKPGVYQVTVIPKDPNGLLLGPGYASMMKVSTPVGEVVSPIRDIGDGSYQAEIRFPRNVQQAQVKFFLGKTSLGTAQITPATQSAVSIMWKVLLALLIILLLVIFVVKKR